MEPVRIVIVVAIAAALAIFNPAAPVWAAALIIAALVLFIERTPED